MFVFALAGLLVLLDSCFCLAIYLVCLRVLLSVVGLWLLDVFGCVFRLLLVALIAGVLLACLG